eukprot:6188141-Pleurochrysis_carterae.AAC.2
MISRLSDSPMVHAGMGKRVSVARKKCCHTRHVRGPRSLRRARANFARTRMIPRILPLQRQRSMHMRSFGTRKCNGFPPPPVTR